MKKHTAISLILLLVPGMFVAASTLPQGKPQVTIQGPFGPFQVDADDPRAVFALPGQPQQQGLPAGGVAAQPAPTPTAAPAAAQNPPAADQPANIALHLDNQDIYQVIRIIADNLQLNYIIDPAVRGTVNINTSGNLR